MEEISPLTEMNTANYINRPSCSLMANTQSIGGSCESNPQEDELFLLVTTKSWSHILLVGSYIASLLYRRSMSAVLA